LLGAMAFTNRGCMRGEDKGTRFGLERYKGSSSLMRRIDMRPLLLWMLGIPIPILILLYLFGVF
jgi:hypothetical protein